MCKIRQILLAAAIAAVAVACGGGGSGMSSASGPMPLVATGTITGFGSVYLNGMHLQTTSATIRKNGQTVAQSALAVGQVARIKGSKQANGTEVANEVDVDEMVVGSISQIDATNNTLTVLGQTVKVNAGTSFSKDIQPADLTGLNKGDVVRVDGFIDADGNIAATRIERGSASDELQVVGTVAMLNSTAHTLKINALVVDYSSASLTGFTGGAPANGDLVEVQGTKFDDMTTTLTATQVTREMNAEEEAAGSSDALEVEGLITSFTSPTDFEVDGQKVATTSSTRYRNGSASDLKKNVKVEIEGTLDGSNVLVAAVVTFEHNGNIELQSTVTQWDAMAGTLTLLGVPVSTTANTRFEDESSAAVAMFNLANVTSGDTIRVHGYESPAGSGKVVATRLERLSPSTTVIVAGPFTAGTSPDFTVLGITIDASSATISDGHGGTLTLAAFLAQAADHGVEVQGTWSGSVVTASEIAIDDHTGDEN